MKHSFVRSLDQKSCAVCGYEQIAHTHNATCEACGLTRECDLFPDVKPSRERMLICAQCTQKEYDAASRAQAERIAKLREHEKIQKSGDYFNADIPAIKDIQQIIEADASIPEANRVAEECKAVKDRLVYLKQVIFEQEKNLSVLRLEERDTRIWLEHRKKQVSAEIQKQLGLDNIVYPANKAKTVKKANGEVKAPSVKKFNKRELTEACTKHNITDSNTIATIQNIFLARRCKDYIEAINVYREFMTKKS